VGFTAGANMPGKGVFRPVEWPTGWGWHHTKGRKGVRKRSRFVHQLFMASVNSKGLRIAGVCSWSLPLVPKMQGAKLVPPVVSNRS